MGIKMVSKWSNVVVVVAVVADVSLKFENIRLGTNALI